MTKLNYDLLVQDALRSVIVQILKHIEDFGFAKDECLRITLIPTVKGVVCPESFIREYENGLCIELQEDKYENLKIGHDRFSVDLYIGDMTEHFVIPFKSIANIVDPSSQFGLEFDVNTANAHDTLPENVVCFETFRQRRQ